MSYRKDFPQKEAPAKTEQKLLSANKVNFLLPKSMIADGYKVSEHWPIVPNLLRASVHHSIDSLKNEGIEYDDAKGQWSQTLFPSWQPSGRADVLMLRRWVNTELAKFNESEPKDSLVDDAKEAHQILNTAFQEITRQVMVHCKERGQLLGELWNSQTALFARTLEISESEAQRNMKKLEEAEVRVEEAKALALDEKINQVLLRREVEEENARLKKDLKEALRNLEKEKKKVKPRSPARSVTEIKLPPDLLPGGGGIDKAIPEMDAKTLKGKRDKMRAERRASARSSIVISKIDEQVDNLQKGGKDESVSEENTALKEMIATLKGEFVEMQKELIRLEIAENNALEYQSRAEYAENRLEDQTYQMRSLTPRPERAYGHASFEDETHEKIVDVLNDALDEPKYKSMSPESFTSMLLGQLENGVPLQPYVSFRGCLENLVSVGKLSRKRLEEALKSAQLGPLEELCPHEVILLIQRALRDNFDIPSFCNFLCGMDSNSNPIDIEYFGSLSSTDVPRHEVLMMVKNGKMSTMTRVQTLLDDKRRLAREIQESQENLNRFMQKEQRKEYARKKREQQQRKLKPLDLFLIDIQNSDVNKFKNHFVALGTNTDVPGFLKFHGKVLNKKMTKRQTEKLVRDIWKSKIEYEDKTGESFYLIDYAYLYFQQQVGIQSAIATEGYNFVYSLQKYSYDADCELFLKVLTGEVMEEVYLEQLELQKDLQKLCQSLDAATSKRDMGNCSKEELRSALLSFFSVGHPNGKQKSRFEELWGKLCDEQSGTIVQYKKLFQEDEDFNQGPFMECVREQTLKERIEYFKEIENVLYEETGYDEKCNEEQVRVAILSATPDLSKLELRKRLQTCFPKGVEITTVSLAVSALKRGGTHRTQPDRAPKKSTFKGRNVRASVIVK